MDIWILEETPIQINCTSSRVFKLLLFFKCFSMHWKIPFKFREYGGGGLLNILPLWGYFAKKKKKRRGGFRRWPNIRQTFWSLFLYIYRCFCVFVMHLFMYACMCATHMCNVHVCITHVCMQIEYWHTHTTLIKVKNVVVCLYFSL